MTGKRISLGLRAAFAILTVTLLVTSTWGAPREKVLHNFKRKNGANPYLSLIFDAAGNLYGTTYQGGNLTKCGGCGTVFELLPQAGGGWLGKVLHSFDGGKNGAYPLASLIFDSTGNLYGTTFWGGWGYGTVFELSPKAAGGWTEKVLHRFSGRKDGKNPYAGLIFDAAGNLYGTTAYGGNLTKCGGAGCGTVFELMPQAGGGWSEKVLHRFNIKDGAEPLGGLIFDSTGNLYGTTYEGGNLTKCGGAGCGTVFELMPQAGGGWTEKVLHSLKGKDGARPYGSPIFDAAGNLYGTTYEGGNLTKCGGGGCGTVFELLPQAGGGWTGKVLHSFDDKDGAIPFAGLIFDAAGNLYGTTYEGGNLTKCGGTGCGTVFELMPQAGGGWTEKVLHSFSGKDACGPNASLVFDAAGNLYGTTVNGGASGFGTVFEIIP